MLRLLLFPTRSLSTQHLIYPKIPINLTSQSTGHPIFVLFGKRIHKFGLAGIALSGSC